MRRDIRSDPAEGLRPAPRLRRQLARFLSVGAVGFLVDGGTIVALVALGLSPLAARAFSFPAAILVTWYLNRSWTFDARSRGTAGRQLGGYALVQTGGAAVNLGSFTLLLSSLPPATFALLGALALSSALGTVVNFLGARFLVFVPRARAGHEAAGS